MADSDSENDSEEESEEEEEEEEEEEVKEVVNTLAIMEDVETIKDIFAYLEDTSMRFNDLALQAAADKAQTQQQQQEQEQQQQSKGRREESHSDVEDDVSLSWSQYEHYDDVQRADLLERAIMALKR